MDSRVEPALSSRQPYALSGLAPCLSSGSSPTTSPRTGTCPRSSRGSKSSATKASSCGRRTPTRSRSTSRSEERDEVRKRFEDSPVQLAGLGSAFEYQAADPAVVRKNIDGTKEYVRLAHDVGSPGVKVRPNGVPRGPISMPRCGRSEQRLHEIGDDAADFGVEIRVEVHGSVTSELPNFAKIMEYADHPNVYTCWNSNPSDVKNGSIKENFALVAPKIHEVHLRDLTDEAYPWRELFALLQAQKYRGLHACRDSREHRPGAACCGISAASGWPISRGRARNGPKSANPRSFPNREVRRCLARRCRSFAPRR